MPVIVKIKQKRGKADIQASRFKSAPAKLADLIDLVNMIPPDYELPDLNYLLDTDPMRREATISSTLFNLEKSLPIHFRVYLLLGDEKVLELIQGRKRDEIEIERDDDEGKSRYF